MITSQSSYALVAAIAGLAFAYPGYAITVSSPANAVLVPVADPLSGATLLNSITASDAEYRAPNLSTPLDSTDTYLAAKVNLTTQVYRTAGGTIAFAYTINSQAFPAPYQSPPPTNVVFPRLTVSGLKPYTADVFSAADYGAIAQRDAFQDQVLFDFVSGDPANRGFTQFLSLSAGDSATLFLLTDATAYQPAVTSLEIAGFLPDATQIPGGFPLEFQSFGAAPVPEPMSLLTLPLAIAAFALKRRR
jgi:hypothetical protein